MVMNIELLSKIKNPKRSAICFFLICAFVYFAFHAIVGNRGLLAYFKLSESFAESVKKLDELKAQRLEIEHKVNLLKSSIDLDMLDQEARRVLGVAMPDEKVFVPEIDDKK
jgi:cell division protein FtsB